MDIHPTVDAVERVEGSRALFAFVGGGLAGLAVALPILVGLFGFELPL